MTSILEKTAGLVAFVRTVDAGSFSAASRLIGSSQSAVSKSVARLERRLGVRLIQRSTRTFSVTAEGQAYYERVAPLLRSIEEAEEVVQVATEAKGLLRVSAPQEFGRMLIAAWAPEFLARHPGVKLELTPAVIMRRMTKVSPYPYWHFFDAYPPGYLRAVYRGNGIPLPWGNLAQVSDPCPNWAVFRMIEGHRGEFGSQISVLRDGERSLLYCCNSLRVRDMAGNPHVLSVGVDLAPALDSNGANTAELVDSIFKECLHRRGEGKIPKAAAQVLGAVANVLNIAWIEDALSQPARIICPRSTRCPRPERCEGARPSRAREIADVRDEILGR